MIIGLGGRSFEAFRPLFLTKYASSVNTAPPQKPRIKTARLCRENLFTMSKPFGKLARPADGKRYTVFSDGRFWVSKGLRRLIVNRANWNIWAVFSIDFAGGVLENLLRQPAFVHY